MKTKYGIKRKGKSRFIIVAPHAAGHDINTEYLAPKIAERLKAFLIVNTKYHKKRKKDFNELSPKKKGGYRWGNDIANRHMKEFYDDILEFIKFAHKYNKGAVVAFIHGMRNYRTKDKKYKMGIDVGCGLKYYRGSLMTTRNHLEGGGNTGVRRAKRKDMKILCKLLNTRLQKSYNLRATIGERFAAWDRGNGVQFLAGEPDVSFQMEIASKLRGDEELDNTSKIISEALKIVYS